MLGSCRPITEPVTAAQFMLEMHRATGASLPRPTPSHRLGLLLLVDLDAGCPSGSGGFSGAFPRVQRGHLSGDAAGERLRTDLQR
jgi:hypothetical protein